jgi:hypothetical protein
MNTRTHTFLALIATAAAIFTITACDQLSGSTAADGDSADGGTDGEDSPSYWANTYPSAKSETPKEIIATADGGYLVVGERSDPSTERMNIWALKLDSGGSVVWGNTYDASARDEVAGAFQTNDGGYIIGGDSLVTDSTGAEHDALVMKLGSGGAISWATAIDLDFDRTDDANATAFYVHLLEENLAGDVFLGGTATLDSSQTGGAQLEPMVIEVTTGGVPSAAYSLDYPGYQELGSILHTGPQRYIFLGTTEASGGGAHYFAARFDGANAPYETNWAVTFWSHDRVTPHLAAGWAFDGNFIVAGPGSADSVYTFRMDPLSGNQLDDAWRVEARDTIVGGVRAIAEIDNHNFMITGTTPRSDGRGDDMWLALLQDDDAAPLATTHIDGLATDGGYSVAAASGSGVVSAGTTEDTDTDYEDLLVVRGDDYGAVPHEAFTMRDDYQIYPNGSAASTDVGPLSVNAHSANIFVSDVKSGIGVQSTVPTKTAIHP